MKGEEEIFNYLTKRDIKEDEKQKLLKASEISIILNAYEDIFSSFDPRPFSNRLLSEDFLAEAKRASREKKSGEIELKFLISEKKRKMQNEYMIKKRLHEYFKKHFDIVKREINSINNKGYFMIILGIIIMIGAAGISFIQSSKFISHLLIILLEPAGWFTFWTGLDQIFYEAKTKLPDLEFYEKMTKVNIKFYSY